MEMGVFLSKSTSSMSICKDDVSPPLRLKSWRWISLPKQCVNDPQLNTLPSVDSRREFDCVKASYATKHSGG